MVSDQTVSDHTGNDDDGKPDAFRDECGVVGVVGRQDASVLCALGLHALQHRGQESAGIVSFDGERFNVERHLGLVGENFSQDAQTLDNLPGPMAIGHVRYATTGGGTVLRNVQPLYADLRTGGIAVAHNGNLTNSTTLRSTLVSRGSIFQSTSDTETILHLIATSFATHLTDRLADALSKVEGAYSLVCLSDDQLIGIRDPRGVRPLMIGRLGEAWILTSETCALDIMGASYVRSVEPGEMVVLKPGAELESRFPFASRPSRFCVFEYVYFSRPDSVIDGKGVYEARKNIGRELAMEAPVEADIISPVPDSGVPAAVGYAQGADLPFEFGIIRNHYVGRTFILPTDRSRQQGVRMKLNANPSVLRGKRVILVDDSIVRGTTSLKIVQMVRDAGAREVHMRIASPPTVGACYYGVDTPETDKLLAHKMSLDEMREHINVDSLAFLSIDGLYRAMGYAKRDNDAPQYCDACFTRDYPIPLVDRDDGADTGKMSFLHN